MARVCIHRPTTTPTGTRCPTCTRTREQARGTREQRGYDYAHRRTRAQLQARQTQGETLICWRCEQPITGDFHLGHDDDRTKPRGPEHPTCNLSAAGRISPHTYYEGDRSAHT